MAFSVGTARFAPFLCFFFLRGYVAAALLAGKESSTRTGRKDQRHHRRLRGMLLLREQRRISMTKRVEGHAFRYLGRRHRRLSVAAPNRIRPERLLPFHRSGSKNPVRCLLVRACKLRRAHE